MDETATTPRQPTLHNLAEVSTLLRTRPVREVVEREPVVLRYLDQHGVAVSPDEDVTLAEALAKHGVTEDFLVAEMITLLMGEHRD